MTKAWKNRSLHLLHAIQMPDCVIFISDHIFDAFSLPAQWSKPARAGEKVMSAIQLHHNNAYITVIPPELICDSLSSREASHEGSGSTFLRIYSLFMKCGFPVKAAACCLCFPAALQKLPSVCTLHHRGFHTACERTFSPTPVEVHSQHTNAHAL